MQIKGVCFHGGDVPNPEVPHFIVILSDETPKDGKVLIVPISSIKFQPNASFSYRGKSCKYFDDACVFDGNEIKDDRGISVLSKPSFARFQWAFELPASVVRQKQLQGIYKYKCDISSDILKKLQEGAKKSEELAPYFAKYFPYF